MYSRGVEDDDFDSIWYLVIHGIAIITGPQASLDAYDVVVSD